MIDNGNGNFGTTMLVSPAYGGMPYGGGMGGGFGVGGDWAWILLLLVLGGGWGGFGGFGMGGMMGAGMMGGMWGMDMLYPWLNNSEHISDGFRDQQLSTQVEGIRGGVQGISQQICQCCGDMRYDMAQGFNGVGNSIFGAQTAITQQMTANEIANLNRSFAEQTANAQGFNGVNAGLSDVRFTIAQEECATRTADAMNTRDIIDSQTRGTQAILDKLCALELDGVRRENDQLRTQLNFANLQASQVAQTAELRASQASTANQLVNELRSCPIPSQPVYGNQPIFTCPQNVGGNCGCGCGGRG